MGGNQYGNFKIKYYVNIYRVLATICGSCVHLMNLLL